MTWAMAASLSAWFSRHGAHGVADLGVRQREHPVAQDLVARRQAMQPEKGDHRPERRAVDEQGEHHEAGREHGNEVLDLRAEGGVLGGGQRQHQGQRAAQAAPGHGELVGRTDRLGELEPLERRYQDEQHQQARRKGCPHQHGQQQQVVAVDAAEQLGHEDRRENEDQRACPERDLVPEIGQERPVVGSDPGTARARSG